MGITTKYYNRLISLYFYADSACTQLLYKIECPKYGRKPTIELNGTFVTTASTQPFNITVKNLKMDLSRCAYPYIKVVAGYENNTVTFKGQVLQIYPESPRPEGTLVIQCQNGEIESMLSKTIDVHYSQGMSVQSILELLNQQLGGAGVDIGMSARALTLPVPLQENRTVSSLLNQLRLVFEDAGLIITFRDGKICAFAAAKGDYLSVKKLNFIRSLPQDHVGDDNGVFYSTINAPWDPSINIGDAVRIPTVNQVNFGVTVGTSKTQVICVTMMAFQFSTTGSANSMSLQGYKI